MLVRNATAPTMEPGWKGLLLMSRIGTKKTSGVLTFMALLLVSGCQLPPPAAPRTTKQPVLVPSMKSKSQNGDAQERGKMVLELPAPVFELKEQTNTTCRPAGTIMSSQGKPLYDIARETVLVAMPPNVEFKLKISNHTGKIVKLSDVLLKLLVDGGEVPVKADEITATTLRPDDTKAFSLVGPSWQTWPKQASVALSVFGVPTEFDDANNVKKTENFDWAFDYEVTSVEKESKLELDSQYLTQTDFAVLCQSSTPSASEPEPAQAPGMRPQ